MRQTKLKHPKVNRSDFYAAVKAMEKNTRYQFYTDGYPNSAAFFMLVDESGKPIDGPFLFSWAEIEAYARLKRKK